MPRFYGVDYLLVGKVKASNGSAKNLYCTKQPSIQQANLLYVLAKHVSRIIELDDLCYQLKCSSNAIRIIATHCRKILHFDWSIESVTNKGLRLSYIGGDLADADFTYLEFNPVVLERRAPHKQTIGLKVRRLRFKQKKPRARFTTVVKVDELSDTNFRIDPATIAAVSTGRTRARL